MKEEKTNNLLRAMKQENAIKETENGAIALNTTFSSLLDLFGEIGALRNRNEKDIIDLFIKAYAEDRLLTLKMLFYVRDVRGGLGERKTFKVILKYLVENYPEDVKINLELIPYYGRWDDLFILLDTPLKGDVLSLIKKQLTQDINNLTNENQDISLLAKWLPSENTSSYKTKSLAYKIRRYLNLSPKKYRKILSSLRSRLKVVEKDMSANNWSNINYETVPSKAFLNYKEAFTRHDETRYRDYLVEVNKGEAKINSSTLYPYDLVKKYLATAISPKDNTVEAQWKALPDYINNNKQNFLIMADVSGSMLSPDYVPISTSVGLAIYFAERSKGAFKNHFITFTDVPRLVNLPENLSLNQKIRLVRGTEGYNTDLEAAFNLVLNSAIKQKVPKESMPTAIVVISDMEIDQFGKQDEYENTSFTQEMSAKFNEAGYKMPVLVYWSVNAKANTFHATVDDNVRFVSGSSPSVFKNLCDNLGSSALELMLSTLNNNRYDLVK